MRKTKIVCTMGPATEDDKVLRELMRSGMAVARFNFSHGDHEMHKKTLERVVRLREELDLPIATMLDTKGPEIRLGSFKNGKVLLKKGTAFTLRASPMEGDETQASISFPDLAGDVQEALPFCSTMGSLSSLCAASAAAILSAAFKTMALSPTIRASMCRTSTSPCPLLANATGRILFLAFKTASISSPHPLSAQRRMCWRSGRSSTNSIVMA
mgnify:CR=1 FL=1